MDQTVKTFHGEKAHQKGVKQMVKKGWRVTNTVTSSPRSGCLRIIMLGGIGALIFRPKNVFVVNFER